MQVEGKQLNIFDQPPEMPDFGGDFEKEMDYIKALPEKEKASFYEREPNCEG